MLCAPESRLACDRSKDTVFSPSSTLAIKSRQFRVTGSIGVYPEMIKVARRGFRTVSPREMKRGGKVRDYHAPSFIPFRRRLSTVEIKAAEQRGGSERLANGVN